MFTSRNLTVASATSLAAVVAMSLGSSAHAQTDRAVSSRVAPAITVKASTSEYHAFGGQAGESAAVLQLTGRAKSLAGTTLKVERRLDGTQKWVGTGRVKVKHDGTFTFRDIPSTTGLRYYRLVGQTGAVSSQVKVDVWRWWPLVRRTGPADNLSMSMVSFNNVPLTDSLLQKDSAKPGFAEYTVGGVCKLATAVVGLNDTSLTGATGSVSISKDGTKVLDKSLAIGAGERVTVDISSAQRVRFDVVTSPTPAGIAGVAQPMVLCH